MRPINYLTKSLAVIASLGLTACVSVEAHHVPESSLSYNQGEKSAETAAIKAAVLDYFHGQGEASEERLNRAFAEDYAVMIGTTKDDDGNLGLKRWEMKETIPNWAANANPPGDTREFAFLSVNVTDDRIATVIFKSTDRFYDALTLIKLDGEWQIVTKAFVRQ